MADDDTIIRLGRDGNPIKALDAVHVEIHNAPNLSPTNVIGDPPRPVENIYYIVADGPSDDDGRSHFFSTSAEGDHEWDGYIFPLAGSYTVKLMRVAQGEETEDQQVTTEAVTVDEPA